MPLFFSLSGYLFVGQKNQPFIEFFSKKTKRLLIPFLSVGFCYMLPIKLILGYPPYQGKTLLSVIKMFLLWKLQPVIPICHPLLNYLKWTMEYEWSLALGAVVFHLTKWTCSMNTKQQLLLGGVPISIIALDVLLELNVSSSRNPGSKF